jgi:ribosomal protein L7/L12
MSPTIEKFTINLTGTASKIELKLTNLPEETALEMASKFREFLNQYRMSENDPDVIARLCVQRNPGMKLAAIKEFKEITGWGLREAKEIVEQYLP